jgi:hypothetical protein
MGHFLHSGGSVVVVASDLIEGWKYY